MYRKAYSNLLDWKNSDCRKPLLMLGARQVGKTWLMKHFGQQEYDNIVYINCDTEPLTRDLFTGDYDINRLLLAFQAITGQPVKPHSSLIILDEIQEAPRALHSLKYFCENAPDYHVMAAGSLLGVTLSHAESFPVGKVDLLRIYPMDFEEFLRAAGQDALCQILAKADYSLAAPFAEKLTDLLYQYYYIGGMPEVVSSFFAKQDLADVRRRQSAIIDSYRRDISKHTSKIESVRIGQVMESLPSQLAKENRKFIYGVAKPGGRAAEFELAIQWLVDAGLVYKAFKVSRAAMPLKFYEEIGAFKLFFLDVGLLGCMAGVPALSLLVNRDALKEFKGMITEQYVAQQLAAAGCELYYWSDNASRGELDFVIQHSDKIYPIEVKASTNVRGKSIAQFLDANPTLTALRFSLLGYTVQNRLINFPLYAVPFSVTQLD